MPPEKDIKKLSKLLSYVLRHHPETINLTLDKNGWVSVDELLKNLNANGHTIDHDLLEHIVVTNEKKRFSFNENKTMIRASQGHSTTVELDYKVSEPPAVLYHGTVGRNLEAILRDGLHKMERHHVHLSADIPTALQVGQRYGKPVLLSIKAKEMFNAGHAFYCSDNGVWLTESVPPSFISVLDDIRP
jgi:putative RNA 2'-phosphotransferase